MQKDGSVKQHGALRDLELFNAAGELSIIPVLSWQEIPAGETEFRQNLPARFEEAHTQTPLSFQTRRTWPQVMTKLPLPSGGWRVGAGHLSSGSPLSPEGVCAVVAGTRRGHAGSPRWLHTSLIFSLASRQGQMEINCCGWPLSQRN